MKKTNTQTVSQSNRAYNAKLKKRERPARMTVADLIDDEAVPVAVRLWLEQFVSEGKDALHHFFVNAETSTLEMARLIFNVLDEGREIGNGDEPTDRVFSDEARDYVQEFIYRLMQAGCIDLWTLPEAAVAALPYMLDVATNANGDQPAHIALESAINRLTTAEERRNFLTGDRYTKQTVKARNIEAGFKLARLLANPNTDAETRDRLDSALLEFTGQASIYVTHAALARRSFTLAADEMTKRRRGKYAKQETAKRRAAYNDLMTLLNSCA